MRAIAGLAVLLIGVSALGYWGASRNAPLIEQKVLARAQGVSARGVHPLVLKVSGRDIEAKGFADSDMQRHEVLAALDRIPGRRDIRAQIDVLPIAAPYILEISKTSQDAPLIATGNAPSEAMASSVGLGGQGLNLATGAPEGWADLVKSAIGALSLLKEGTALLRDDKLQVVGTAQTPREQALAQAILAQAGAGADIEVADDGKPVAWQLSFDPVQGAEVTGKLPKGWEPSALASALGLKHLAGAPLVATKGEAFSPSSLKGLAPWLAQVESLQLNWSERATSALASVQGGVEVEGLKDALEGAGFSSEIKVITPIAEAGESRINAASGAQEYFMGGYWLVDPKVEVSLAGCQTAADNVLKDRTINFITSSSDLDASAVGVINDLARFMRACAQSAGMKVEIGGHTDNTGDATANLELSARRAEVVRRELISRGVTADVLSARGYGMGQPIADNSTEEGRAINRRTTILWSN